jgi:hypothetical protein
MTALPWAVSPWLADRWLAAALAALGLAALLTFVSLRRRRVRLAVGLAVAGVALVLLGAGGLALPRTPALWLLAWAALTLALMLAVLALSTWWSRPSALAVAALGLFGLGGAVLRAAGEEAVDAGRALVGMRLKEPWWLLLLLAIPFVVLLSRRRLTRGEVRPWVSVGLRCALVALLALALAEPFLAQASRNVTVLFVVDRSLSIPEQLGDDPAQPGARTDLRTLRLRDFINEAVRRRGPGHERDRAGLIVFGRRPRLELPPSDAPRFNLDKLPPAEDGNYTDIAAALKLALASFPEGTGKRVVLISDGNENIGSAVEQAQLAKTLGVQIDVLPLAAGQRNEEEVLVERVDAPPLVERGTKIPIRVLVRSHNPQIVFGRLVLRQITDQGDGKANPVKVIAQRDVLLRLGLNVFAFDRPLADEQRSYTYEAEFQPLGIQNERGEVVQKGLPGDRVQNNRAAAHVVARGQGRVLLLENEAGAHQELVERLVEAGRGRFKVVAEPVSVLDNYKERDKLAVFLSNFDCVILANVPAERVSEEQQEALRANTHDQGCGLVMIGGPDGFGAGGWQKTAVEKALPVDADIQSLKVQGKGGLVLIMHASEMADGNRWQKKIAKLAVERLGPVDEVGVLDWSMAWRWQVKMQEVGPNRAAILAAIDKLAPGDIPDLDPALKMAYDALTDPAKNLAAKHIIFISDGDHWQHDMALVRRIRAAKITIATVGVATHGPAEDTKMRQLATTPSRYYKVNDPKKLPAIYTKETRLVSQAFVHKKRFTPVVSFRSGPTAKLPDLPPLGGFVRTTPKPSPLVEVPVLTPQFLGQDFPLLAYWHYGLGKAVAFTSDAGKPDFWSRAWLEGGGGRGGVFSRFWEQVIGWALRPLESGRLLMTTEYRDGKVRVTVEARTQDGKPDTKLNLRGGITAPGPAGGAKQELRFVQKNSGVYEAEVKAEEAGSYFLTAQATRARTVKGRDGKERVIEEGVDSVRAGVTLPYSPEFADLESNTPLLEHLREITDGRTYEDDGEKLAEAAKSGEVFRAAPAQVKSSQPFHSWVLVLAGLLLFFDVAVRRLAFDAREVAARFEALWARLRGFPAPPPLAADLPQRLQARRLPAPSALAARRFEGAATAYVPTIADASAPLPRVAPLRSGLAESAAPGAPEAAPGDFADRLLKAKRKVWEERNKDNPQE